MVSSKNVNFCVTAKILESSFTIVNSGFEIFCALNFTVFRDSLMFSMFDQVTVRWSLKIIRLII
jgi:hypothetical protein